MKLTAIAFFCMVLLLLPVRSTAELKGIASWYGGGEKLNEYTANGEVFDPQNLACASWEYPFNAYLRVTNILTGKSVIVRVNDRGPARRLGRAIDLTRYAFCVIAELKDGLAPVTVERVK